MKMLLVCAAIGTVTACGGGSRGPSAPTVTNAVVDGSYNATITASSSCSANLPSETRTLNYIANITQTGSAVQVTLLAHVIWNAVAVVGTVSGQTINFSNFSFSEITTGGGVGLAGTGTATAAGDGSISGILNGTFQAASGPNCIAADHQVQMVKR